MFYCKHCREKYDYPESFSRSEGKCEICDAHAVCYDVPSRYLPKESPEEDVQEILDTVITMHSTRLDVFLDDTVESLSKFSKTSQKVLLGRVAQRLGLTETFEAIKKTL